MTSEHGPAATSEQLVHEALTKSGMLWVGADAAAATAVWFAYDAPYVLLVTGPTEQAVPDLGAETTLVLRAKDSRALLIQLPARVERLAPDDERWPRLTATLAASRLNSDLLPAQLPERWAQQATVYALTPDPARAAIEPAPDAAHRAPPRPVVPTRPDPSHDQP